MNRTKILAFFGAAVFPVASGAWGLGVGAYLDQVRLGNPALQGSRAEDAALALSAKQPLTAFSPQLGGQFQYQDNQELPAGSSLFSPADTEALTWDTNLSKFFSTGTQVGLDYSGNKTSMLFPGASQFASTPGFNGFLPYPNTYGQQWNVNVSQSLWRNFMAAQTDASLDKAKADADSERAQNAYQAQAVLLQARQAYIALTTARSVSGLYAQTLKRDQDILEWTRRKVADNLADQADLLESEAALSQAGFDLDQSRDDEAKAETLFNALRGSAPGEPVGALDAFRAPGTLPDPKPGRQDLLAAQAALRSSDAQVKSVTQSFTPDLSVFAQVGDEELNPQYEVPGMDGGFRPDTLVGLKFSANLDFLLYKQVVAGARKAQGYGRAQVEDKRLEIARDWAELKADFDGARVRLGLASKIEALQKRKADRENALYLDGRTTHFQVLRSQSDYDQARIQTLRLAAQAGDLEAQARYYNGDDRPW